MKTNPLRSVLATYTAALLLTGCETNAAHSPTVDVLGSYFPAWMMCIIIGLFITVIIRLLFVGLGVHRYIPLKPIVYIGMSMLLTALIWLMFFKN